MTNSLLKMRLHDNRELGLHKSVLQLLGNPAYIIFFSDANNRTVFIGAEDKPNNFTISIPERCYTRDNSFRIINRNLVNALCNIFGSERYKTIKIQGEFIPELKMISFKITSEEVCNV